MEHQTNSEIDDEEEEEDFDPISFRYFTCQNEKSNKFWRIGIRTDNVVMVHFGRIDTDGQYSGNRFATKQECEKHLEKMVREKLKKGYIEQIKYVGHP